MTVLFPTDRWSSCTYITHYHITHLSSYRAVLLMGLNFIFWLTSSLLRKETASAISDAYRFPLRFFSYSCLAVDAYLIL
jgi:hypothetical protein